MIRKVARAVPVRRRWGLGGGWAGVGSKRLWGHRGRLNRTDFWNLRDCGILQPDQDLGLRSRRWAVRWASGLDGITLFFPHVRICWDRGRCLCVCGRSVFLASFLTFLLFFSWREGFFSPQLQFLFPSCQLLKPVRGRGERSKLSQAPHLTS